MATNKEKLQRQRRKEELRKLRRRGADAKPASQPKAPALSPLDESAADDGHRRLRNTIRELSKKHGHWAGVPMPLHGEELVIEPGHPFAKALGRKPDDQEPQDFKLRNTFYSSLRRCDVYVCEEATGRVTKCWLPAVHSIDKQLRTLGCSDAWGLEQEEKALATFRTLVTPRQYRLYALTGSFLESSKRSGVMYMFRKLRPTVAIDMDHPSGSARVLCCLCMHPIAHYADSWAGAMCPTDDVIAALMMMRGDERLFWKRSTQHPASRPEAGV